MLVANRKFQVALNPAKFAAETIVVKACRAEVTSDGTLLFFAMDDNSKVSQQSSAFAPGNWAVFIEEH